MATQRKGGKSAGGSGGSTLSVVVPAYNETDNIRPLCERLFKALKASSIDGELLIMDDESVGTAPTKAVVAELKTEGYNIRIHARTKKEGKGLSSAVLLGFDMAANDTMLCMDADLQHEPESVPDVAAPILNGTADFTVGSRNVDGGGLGFEWSLLRRIISQGATLLCLPLTTSTDPMSGFFCVSKETLAKGRANCNPIGFKIGLEIMARCRYTNVVDVPITFQDRVAGESKLSMKQNVLYLQQLAALYWDKFGFLLVLVVVILLWLALQVLSMLF